MFTGGRNEAPDHEMYLRIQAKNIGPGHLPPGMTDAPWSEAVPQDGLRTRPASSRRPSLGTFYLADLAFENLGLSSCMRINDLLNLAKDEIVG